MARMHSSGRGKSCSMKPFTTDVQTYMTQSIPEVKKMIIHLANRGISAACIGNVLRDEYGVGNCKDILGMNMVEFLRANGAAPAIPDDLTSLMEKSNRIRQHLVQNRKDNDAKYRLTLINSRIHRLVRYYKEKNTIPVAWKPFADKLK